jgi:hypothetical protein
VAGSGECCDEPSGSGATELVKIRVNKTQIKLYQCVRYRYCTARTVWTIVFGFYKTVTLPKNVSNKSCMQENGLYFLSCINFMRDESFLRKLGVTVNCRTEN